MTTKTMFVVAGLCLGATATAQQVEFQPRMGEPIPGLTAAQTQAFENGAAEFNAILLPTEGLGPLFNDTSCGGCHGQPALGGFSTTTVTRFGKKASGGNPFDPLDYLGGTLMQKDAIADPCLEVVPPEADVVTLRQTPQTFGVGLLEAIPTDAILANALNPPHPSVSGVARMVTPIEGGPARPGRMGWKGGVATVFTFSADASLNEMGLTTSFFPQENAPNGDQSLLGPPTNCDTVADPEDIGDQRIARQTDFQAFLAPPPQTPKSGMTGEAIFDSIGCSACHVRTFTTGGHSEAVLNGHEIHPYSDFLLHNMGLDSKTGGDGCGDGIVDGPATELEMMTRSLWGMGQRQAFLHDGRATGGTFEQNVDATIQDHGGEAAFARNAYNSLTVDEQIELYAFLGSLGRPEFDEDNNNRVEVFDWFFLFADFTGPAPAQPVDPDDHGAVADIDQDKDFDMIDFLAMQRAFTGQ